MLFLSGNIDSQEAQEALKITEANLSKALSNRQVIEVNLALS